MRFAPIPLIFVAVFAKAATAFAGDAPSVIFDPKVFFDGGDVVHVEGTMVGNDLAFKVNRTALSCFRDRQECQVTQINSEGIHIFSIRLPEFFTIREWTSERIRADFSGECYQAWIINRQKKTAEYTEQSCSNHTSGFWTIEDPPFWKNEPAKQ